MLLLLAALSSSLAFEGCSEHSIPTNGFIELTKSQPYCISTRTPFFIFGENPLKMTVRYSKLGSDAIIDEYGPIENAVGILTPESHSSYLGVAQLEGEGKYNFFSAFHLPSKDLDSDVIQYSYITTETNLRFEISAERIDSNQIIADSIQWLTPYNLSFTLDDISEGVSLIFSESGQERDFQQINGKGEFHVGTSPFIQFNHTTLTNSLNKTGDKVKATIVASPKYPFIDLVKPYEVPQFTFYLNNYGNIVTSEDLTKQGQLVWTTMTIIVIAVVIVIVLIFLVSLFCICRNTCCYCKKSKKNGKKKGKKNKRNISTKSHSKKKKQFKITSSSDISDL